MIDLSYVLLDIKEWAWCHPQKREEPAVTRFIEAEAKRIERELWLAIEGKIPKFPEFAYTSLYAEGVANATVVEHASAYFEILAYHLHLKLRLVNAATDNQIVTSTAGKDENFQSLIMPTNTAAESLTGFREAVQEYWTQFGVVLEAIDSSELRMLPEDGEDFYVVSRRTSLAHPDDWQKNLDEQRINLPDEDAPLVERIRALRKEFFRFYVAPPLLQHELAERGISEQQHRTWGPI